MPQDDTSLKQGSGYVPAIDDNGIRKTFATPSFVDNIPNKRGRLGIRKYPWDTIKVGESFDILYSEMKKTSLAPVVSKMQKKYKRKFKITDVPDHNCYLISCIPMTLPEAAQGGSLIDALNNLKEGE